MTAKRSVSKKTRFEVFKRDAFCCQYCGASPPNVILEVDHVIPVSGGGSNDELNLITACFDCNRGKGARTLNETPETIKRRSEIEKEKITQLKAYEDLLIEKREYLESRVDAVESVYEQNTDYVFTMSFRQSVKAFCEKLPLPVVIEAMEVATDRIEDANGALKYFCGICWARVRKQEGE